MTRHIVTTIGNNNMDIIARLASTAGSLAFTAIIVIAGSGGL